MMTSQNRCCWKWFLLILLIMPELILAAARGKIMGFITDASNGTPLPGANVVVTHSWKNNQPVALPNPLGAAADLKGEFVILNLNPGLYNVKVMMMGYAAKTVEQVSVSINRTTPLEIKLKEETLNAEEVVVTAEREVIKKDMTSATRTVSAEQLENYKLESVGAVVALQAGVVEGHFRGGRSGEVSYLIDGVQSDISLHTDAVQEIEVISGTFNAEYGKVMSGIVNAAPKEGGDQHNFSVKLFTGNWLTGHNDYVGLDKSDVLHQTEMRVNYGGPVPFTGNKLSLFIFGRYGQDEGLWYGIRRYTMNDWTNIGQGVPAEDQWDVHTGDSAEVPMTQRSSGELMANLVWHAATNWKFGLLYQYSTGEGQEGYNHSNKYIPDRQNRSWNTDQSATFSINQMLGSSAFHEGKFLYAVHSWQSSRFKDPYDSRYVNDKYSTSMGGFNTGGNSKDFGYADNHRFQMKYDLVWQITGHHELKLGADYVKQKKAPHGFSLTNWYSIFDKENEDFFYKPYIPADTSTAADRYTKYPVEFSAYIQDKSEFDALVINYGLRYDWYNPNTIYPTDLRNPANVIAGDRRTEYLDADPQYQLSPRLGLSYKLGETAALHFSYGHFFQIPNYDHIYQNPNYEISTSQYGSSIGNPNIKAEKTVKYELGLQYRILHDVVLNTDVFYHDIYNLETVVPIETYDTKIYGFYSNKDYASSKGMTLGADYQKKSINVTINYTLQYAEGNASEPFSNFAKAAASVDPTTIFIPLDWDQRHTLKFAGGYNTNDFGVSITGQLGSGTRYTFSPPPKSRLELTKIPENAMTKPATFYLDLKGFYNLNFFKIAGIRPQLGFYIYNILDLRNEAAIFTDSGKANSTLSIEENRKGYVSTFTTIEDSYYGPFRYSAPRFWKLELGLSF